MAPLTLYQIVQAKNDPTGSEYMDLTSPQYLVTEITDLKATMRNMSLGLPWITLLGLTSVNWTAALAWAYVSATQAKIQGDQTVATGTGYLQVNQRVRAFVTAGTIYGYITAASYSSPNTTITVEWDSGQLDSGLTDIQTAGDVKAWDRPITLHTTADQTLQTSPTADTTLILQIGENEMWSVRYLLYFDEVRSTLTITPSVPSGATFIISSPQLPAQSNTALDCGVRSFLNIDVLAICGTTAGQLVLQYDVHASGGTLLTDSFMIAQRLM
jgi:hypothetical protein